jgi:GntR family transcriptional regulator, rspAB operon transcriptional repressor
MAFSRRGNREPIAGQAYAAIKRRILDLTFKPRESLSETRLAAEFGLSRTPVREALKRLETDGLIDVIPQYGTFVSPIRREFVMDAQFAREALECAVVREATRLRTEEALQGLEANLVAQEATVRRGDYATLYRLDEELHQGLTVMAARPAIWALIADIKIHMDRARQLTLRPDHAPNIVAQHRSIITAVGHGNADEAAEAMSRHLRFVIEHFDEFISANARYSAEIQREIV